jgi:hypothetical protein
MTQLTFSFRQQQYIETGKKKRELLVKAATKAAKSNVSSDFRHHHLYSEGGLGKTYAVQAAVAQTQIPYFTISGNISMFAFGVQLAVINHNIPEGQEVAIIVDDCDELFKNETNINIMKKALDKDAVFSYEKSLQAQWSNLTEAQQIAIEAHSNDRQMGFTVPTNRMKFIVTSNIKLPTNEDVKIAQEKGQARARHLNHMYAIRTRFKNSDIDLTSNEQWGWIADVVLDENSFKIPYNDKVILLDWMFSNWDNMNERSIRTAEKMIETMVEDPTGYKDEWEFEFLTK